MELPACHRPRFENRFPDGKGHECTERFVVRAGVWIVVVVFFLFVCLDLLLLLIVRAQVPPATGIYFWSSLVWFSWYWYARSFKQDCRAKALAAIL